MNFNKNLACVLYRVLKNPCACALSSYEKALMIHYALHTANVEICEIWFHRPIGSIKNIPIPYITYFLKICALSSFEKTLLISQHEKERPLHMGP